MKVVKLILYVLTTALILAISIVSEQREIKVVAFTVMMLTIITAKLNEKSEV